MLVRLRMDIAQACFDVEAFWSFDILQVNTSEGGGYGPCHFDKTLNVLSVDFNVKHIHVGKNLK